VEGFVVSDLIYLALGLGLFGLMIVYVRGATRA
jgi:hypothetical protein